VSTELERRLIERINREGPISFRDFMWAALYDPELGYYNTERLKIGPEGDYYTSSNVHPAFGATLARAFAELWAGSVKPLTIVEMGAGTGQLACDVLSAMRDEHPAIFQHLIYVIVETSPAMRNRQMDKLAAFGDHIQWRTLEEIERTPVIGIAFSNEFVDAMPVHCVRSRGSTIEEQYVGTGADTRYLASLWDKPSDKRLGEYLERMELTLREGQIIEINLDAIDWLARLACLLRHGFLVTIDYGDVAQHLYAQERGRGTLRSFYGHRLIDSPLERVGEQDITASVNFTALIEYGRDSGFEVVTYERQIAFLTRFGLIERIVAAAGHEEDTLDDLKDRLALKNLFVPGGVSDNFRVLIQRKQENK
jgi:SAM-dependent MidA family methyltransferase